MVGGNHEGGGVTPPLPRPVTINDEYLAAILDELRALRAELAARPGETLAPGPSAERVEEKAGEAVELSEPAPARKRGRRKG